MYRGGLWKEGLQTDSPVEKATQEAMNRFGIVIEIDSHSESEIDTTVKSIQNSRYDNDKISIVLSVKSSVDKNFQGYVNFVTELQEDGFSVKLLIHTTDDQAGIDKDAFSYLFTKKFVNYVVKIPAGTSIDSGFLSFIDEDINVTLNQTVFFEDVAAGARAVMRPVVNHTYPKYNNYDIMCEELREISKDQGNYRKYEKEN